MFNNMFLRLFIVKGRKYLSVPHLTYEGAEGLQQGGQVQDVHLVQGVVNRANHAEHRVQALLQIEGVNKISYNKISREKIHIYCFKTLS